MPNERTALFLRAFEKYVDARLQFVLGQRERQETGDVTLDRELAGKQHRSDLALQELGTAATRAGLGMGVVERLPTGEAA